MDKTKLEIEALNQRVADLEKENEILDNTNYDLVREIDDLKNLRESEFDRYGSCYE